MEMRETGDSNTTWNQIFSALKEFMSFIQEFRLERKRVTISLFRDSD